MIDEVLTGRRVRLRPVLPADEPALTRIFTDPEVARWWGDPSRSVHDVLNPEESESCFLVEAGDEPIGMIQCVEETDPMYKRFEKAWGPYDANRAKWEAHGPAADLTKDDDIRGLGEKVQSGFGHVNILVLCGGAISHGALDKASLADFDLMYRSNLRGHYALGTEVPLLVT